MFRFGVLRIIPTIKTDISHLRSTSSRFFTLSRQFSCSHFNNTTLSNKRTSSLLSSNYNKLKLPQYVLATRMSTSTMNNKYDLVVFGATGFTGQYVVEEVARVAKMEGQPLTWAIAGRSKDKLVKSLEEAKREVDFDTSSVGVLVADVKDNNSIVEMAKQSKVVINCVGPYYQYGEPVIEACINNGASHVDISGEPVFLEGMQLKYDKKAEEAGVHIVGACGYDSVPADMGVCHMIKNFPGELNSVETYVTTKSRGAKTSIHTGTMESAVLAIQSRDKFNNIRRQLYSTKLPKPKYPVGGRGSVHHNEDLGLWAVPLPTDEPMVYRTQRYRHDVQGLRPIQYKGYLALKSRMQAIGTLIGMLYFAFLAYFKFTSSLLIKYPEILTAGVFTRAGADREELKKLTFTSILVGRGWSQKLSEGTDEYATPPDATVTVKVSGPDPGYGATSLMMVGCAMTILKEQSQCTRRGGVMTPGIAFMNTGLIDRLVKRGMTFSVE